MKSRGKIDDTLAAMFSSQDYSNSYLFYAHMVGQCSIKIDYNLPAPAGVSFMHDHYNLYINPIGIKVPFQDESEIEKYVDKFEPNRVVIEDGEKFYQIISGFDSFPLVERLGILKHEMLHVLYDHVQSTGRAEGKKHEPWNISTDCALNQHIDQDHLPKIAILPKNLGEKLKIKVPENESSEFYYELLKQASNNKNGSGNLEDALKDFNTLDSHDQWDKSEGDSDLQKDLTKKMIQKSQEETIKSKGTVPNLCSAWLELHSRKSEINWKSVLRRIVGNKRVGKRSTIMRKNRRFPGRDDLRGNAKDRTFNLLVIADVSGSMSQEAIVRTISEVKHICDITKTSLDLIQIDTQPHEPEKITKKTKFFTRKSSGGTMLFPAIEKAKEYNIDYQAVVVLTDGYLFDNEVEKFRSLNKKIIWLIEPSGKITDDMDSGKMKAFKLSNEKS